MEVYKFVPGVYTVLVTPFTDDDKIDFDGIKKWLEYQESIFTISGIVLLGTTSESPTLSRDEQLEIVK